MTRALQNHLPDLTHFTTLAGLWMPQYLRDRWYILNAVLLSALCQRQEKLKIWLHELAELCRKAYGGTARVVRAGPLRRFSARCAVLVVKVELHSHTAAWLKVTSCTAEPGACYRGGERIKRLRGSCHLSDACQARQQGGARASLTRSVTPLKLDPSAWSSAADACACFCRISTLCLMSVNTARTSSDFSTQLSRMSWLRTTAVACSTASSHTVVGTAS